MSRRSLPPSPALLLAVIVLVVATCAPATPPAETLRLVPAGDTVLTPYGDVTDAAWLDGNRWVVIAPQDRAVSVADLVRRKLSPFAGSRAKELEQPFHLFRSGDSVYVADWQRRRLTAWSLAGSLGGRLPAVDALRGALPRARDAQGNWYFELRAPPGRDGGGNRDSAAIVRTRGDLTNADTIARLAPLDLAEVISEGRRRLERRLLSGQDRWGVLPDGSLWIARVSQNRVDWRDPSGAVRRGHELPDPVLPVTENDRQLFLRKFDATLRPTVSQIPFVAIKPPFENAFTGPDGLVWLVKNRAIGDTLRRYQLIDRNGQLVGTAAHHGLGQLLALGEGHGVVAEPFEGGVRLLDVSLPGPDSAAPAGAP
jgi:hypothetical protein